MSRLVPVLSVACALGIGITVWSQLNASSAGATIPNHENTTNGPKERLVDGNPLRTALQEARRKCAIEALDPILDEIRQATVTNPNDAKAWRLLAEAHLERAQQRTHLRGMQVGKPLFSTLPEELQKDLTSGLQAVKKARELGDKSGLLCRIEAGLMSQHITGFTTAIKWNGKIGRALELASARAGDDPQLHTALGLRKLLAPTWFGHDAEVALEHFEYAAKDTKDERPAVFAAMASHLQNKRQQAIAWLDRAIERNPNNKFARVCRQRLRRGEEDPFGRDVTAEEVAAAK